MTMSSLGYIWKISDGVYSSKEFPLFQGCKENVEPDKYASGGRISKIFKRE